jgi:class 3 adenylate cyclase
MEREVRYCTSEDGTSIAYCVEGEGPPLLECPGTWESFANGWEDLTVYESLRRGRTSVRYDFRGVGLSQRDAPSYALDRMTADLDAVIRSAGLERFSLWASTFSVGPSLVYAATHPDQVARLILTRVITRGTDVMPRENADALVALVRSNWEMASVVLGDMGTRSVDPLAGVRIGETMRENADAEAVAGLITEMYETGDVHDILSDIKCPTLIMHRKDDTGVPFAGVQNAAAKIPGARLVPLPGTGPASLGPDAQDVIQAMAAFLDEDPDTRAITTAEPVTASDSALRAVLFTDIVGHTEMMSRLGDDRGRDVLREHEAITRDVLAAHGGTEVKTMGDGFMASFGSVTKSVDCAIALQRAFAERKSDEPLHVRAGINAGEPIEEDGDLFGATVILASRIAAKAEGGEILVADTVRGLCSGKGFLFADRGEFVAKGFEDPVRLFEVRWRGND